MTALVILFVGTVIWMCIETGFAKLNQTLRQELEKIAIAIRENKK